MKKFLVLILFAASALYSSAYYSFSAAAPSGQMLYYVISGSYANVVAPEFRWNGYEQPAGALTIPDSVVYNGRTYPVVSIGDRAFSECDGLTSVAIPNTISSIKDYAFDGCDSLTIVEIPSSVIRIGAGAFGYCTNLSSVTISNSVRRIGDKAFCHCASLAKVVIPNSVTELGSGAFSYCGSLTRVGLSGSATTIKSQAFYYCDALESIVIPNSVKTIEDHAFCGCIGLKSLTIGDSVSQIGNWAFAYCRNLTEITANPVTAPALASNVMGSVPSDIPVYVPCGSRTSYESVWSHFSNFEEGVLLHAASSDETKGRVAVLQRPGCDGSVAQVEAVPAEGYMFDHWSDGTTETPYTLTVTGDTTLTAYFVADGTVGVRETASANASQVMAEQGAIVVRSAMGERVQVFDLAGRLLHQGRINSDPWRFAVGRSGIYIVRVTLRPAQKVAVWQ